MRHILTIKSGSEVWNHGYSSYEELSRMLFVLKFNVPDGTKFRYNALYADSYTTRGEIFPVVSTVYVESDGEFHHVFLDREFDMEMRDHLRSQGVRLG